MTERETAEISDVAQLLDNLQFAVRQSWWRDDADAAKQIVPLVARLRALLPQPESLEEAVEDVLSKSDCLVTRDRCVMEISAKDVARLRQALKRNMEAKS